MVDGVDYESDANPGLLILCNVAAADSTYGHIYQLAQKVKAGVDSVPGFEGVLLQVPEILPEEVLKAMHAPPKPDVPVAKAADLPQYDGIIFGAPTRFGMVAAQMKAFIDSTGGLWQSGALVGKPASVFVSTGTQGGGIETTALTFYTQLAHHGMVIVPTGYSFGERLFGMDEVRAGTAYGASTYAGPTGARQPSELELDYAQHQGSYFARIAGKLTA
ncbi:hypothetical protein N2152v2_005665 [Parachlorella kessleri]